METMETQVKNVIEKIRPYIQRDGGDEMCIRDRIKPVRQNR